MFFRKASRAKVAAAEHAKDDPWRSGRSRWSLQQFRRGRDHKWHFSGQQADEVVRLIVRRSKLYLIKPAFPLLGTLLALGLTIWGHFARPEYQGLWITLEVILSGAVLGALIWFIWRDFVLWWLETYIITNQRIISSRGILQPVRQQTELSKVTQVGIAQEGLLPLLLSYGTVHVYLTGGEFFIRDVPNPKRVKDAIQGISDEIKARSPKPAQLPVPQDPGLVAVLDKLAKGKDLPKLHDADAHYPARHPDRLRGPHRTFGGFLRIPCDVRYSSGEFTVEYIQRSRYVLYRNLALPIFFSIMVPLAALRVALVLPQTWIFVGLVELGLLITGALIITNYVDDVFILTNKRIIDINRRLIFLYESRLEIEYKSLRNVKVTVSNVLERLLDIGNVFVETPGNSKDIIMLAVDHPFIIQDKIYSIKDHKEKVDSVTKENASKKEFNLWFTNVVTTLENKFQSNGTPNLQRLDFWSAVERAGEFGLEVVAVGEEPAHPEMPPGMVVRQSPPPGTLISQGGEIQVFLSRRG